MYHSKTIKNENNKKQKMESGIWQFSHNSVAYTD